MTTCIACGVQAHSLTAKPMPDLFVCGKCAKAMTEQEILELAREHTSSAPADRGAHV